MPQTIRAHLPVLLNEVIEALHIDPNGIYLDATFGRGGHSEAILAKLSLQGRLICLDKDPEALAFGKAKWGNDPRVSFAQCCFSELDTIAEQFGITNQINGILIDCGVSSPQLDDPKRGFSFLRDGPLDMRMDPTKGISAREWLETATFADMMFVFKVYGEEPFAKQIARKIEATRKESPLLTTHQLAELVRSCVPPKKTHRHPATQIFQAIRIHVNQELEAIKKVLTIAPNVLAPEGRLALISFHSLEDRIIKRFFRAQAKVTLPKGVAIPEKELKAPLEWIIKRQQPSEEEVASNPRARSATLRVAKKSLM